MEIKTRVEGDITVVELVGEIDGTSAPEAQEQIVPLATPGCKIVLDMTGVSYMSSAGLRLLLVTYRTIAGGGGKVVIVGLAEGIKDTMAVTGFLDFFSHHETLDAGLAELA